MISPALPRWFAVTLLACLALFACCPMARTPPVPPPPISLDEQARQLTEWSHQFPMLKATTVTAGVRFDYRDEKGNPHSEPAEGTLLIRQHFADVPSPAGTPARRGDVLLLGKSFDKPVFEAGSNDTLWWFIFRLDPKSAWEGDVDKPINWAALADERTSRAAGRGILRADLVLDLLALSDLPANPPANPRQRQLLLMRVNDFSGTNDLFIEELTPPNPLVEAAPRPYLAREILVDRFTGHVSEVRIYNPEGVLFVRSQLSDFAPVSYEDATKAPPHPPLFPRKIIASYPAQKTTISLQFDTVTIPASLRPHAFDSPDWQQEQIAPIHVD